MTRLLVSVRDAEEAEIAVAAGADIIDLKEPSRGSLGAVSPEIAEQVARSLGGRRPLSLALGELFSESSQWSPFGLAEYGRETVAAVDYAKVGTAGADRVENWRELWLEWRLSLPGSIQPVVVSYVDPGAGSPSPEAVLNFAHSQSICTVLLDTYCKNGDENLLTWISEASLNRLIMDASARGIRLAIAGSISTETLLKAKVMNPCIVAVRSAACVGGRGGKLCANRVAQLKEICGPIIAKRNR